ncbi:hypothetical protein DFAR_340021 [Desulfarculales bacterium]
MDTDKQPHEVLLEVAVDRGVKHHCPECGRLCEAHDVHEFTGCTSIFFSIIVTVTVRVPRVDCPDNGT